MSAINRPPSEFLEARIAVAKRIAEGGPEPKAPKALRWQEIETIPELFQQRRMDVDASAEHVQTLARAIKRGPRGAQQDALEAITVLWVGGAWACVDGHHRLTAYQWVEHPAPVPVRVLKGATLEEAIRESLMGNSKDKLPLTKRCKSEAAWRFTVEGSMSKATVAALAAVDESTVAAMRRTLREFRKAHPGTPPEDFTWADMRHGKHQLSEEAAMVEADQRAAERLLRRTEKHIKGVPPRVLLLMLGMHSPGLVSELFQLHQTQSESDAYRMDPFAYIPSTTEEHPEF